MKKHSLIAFTIFAMGIAACSGNKADGKDTRYPNTDSVKKDSTVHSSSGKDSYNDSTSNAPRMPGGN